MRYVQGFLVPGKQCGIWLFNSSGVIVSEFNPCGLQEPQGEKHELRANEEIIGFYETKVEMDLIQQPRKITAPTSYQQNTASVVTSFGLVTLQGSN